MRSKLIILTIIVLSLLTLTACSKNKDAIAFKSDYESLNGKENKNGKVHRTVSISENNPSHITLQF